MTQDEYISALSRLGLDGPNMLARKLLTLGDERPWLTILRTTQRLRRSLFDALERSMPWSIIIMVRLLEREQELEAEIAELRYDNGTMYNDLMDRLNDEKDTP